MTSRKGYVMIASYGLMVFLSVIGSAILVRALVENNAGLRSAIQQRGLFLAESGIEASIDQLRGGVTTDIASTVLGGGTYSAQILDSTETTGLGPLDYLIYGNGTYASNPRQVLARVTLTANSVFQYALFGESNLTVSGDAVTDSYDSSGGATYDPNTAGSNGDVGTNSVTAGAVDVSGSIVINGQIAVGEGGDPDEVVVVDGGSAIITGVPPMVTQSSNLSMPAINPPGGLDCSQSWSVNGGNETLPADAPSGACDAIGNCCLTNLSVAGGAEITMSQPITLFVTGAFTATGNAELGVETDPTQFLMVLTSGSSSTIEGDLTGSTQFYGGIYSADGTVNIHGNAEIFGSVIAENVNITGNAQVHYDEALSETGPIGSYDVQVLDWYDLN